MVGSSMQALSRRDANAFVKAVKRYGLPSRLPQIAVEVGPVMEHAPQNARLSLWHSLMNGCREAVRVAEIQGEDAKVRDVFQNLNHRLKCQASTSFNVRTYQNSIQRYKIPQ